MIKELILKSINKNLMKKAIQVDGEILTYGQLKDKSINAAKKLVNYSNKLNIDEPCCGLLFDHGISGIIAIISCIMAELIYVPLDSSNPEHRLFYMVTNSKIKILITDYNHQEFVNELIKDMNPKPKVYIIEELIKKEVNLDLLNVQKKNNSITYLLYTSGSTGAPKGVLQREESIINFANNYINNLNITSNDNITLFSTYGHDAAIIDIFSGLLSGACLYPLDLRISNNLFKVSRWLRENEITIWHSVPSIYRAVWKSFRKAIDLPMLRYVVLGGEALREEDFCFLNKCSGNYKLYSLYGQTESSYSCGKLINKKTEISLIGLPINKTRIIVACTGGSFKIIESNKLNYIKKCPVLSKMNIEDGEMLINSRFIADGYWCDEKLTAKMFIDSPVLGRVYRTGDFVKVINDNQIMFQGRKDSQIKIRGHRVELTEIESKIIFLEEVSECIVLPKINDYRIDLIAFIKSKRIYSTIEINNYLINYIPTYMLISEVVILDNIPHTVTGKVDRQNLIERLKEI